MATYVKISADLLLANDFILLLYIFKTIPNKDPTLKKLIAKRKRNLEW